MSDDTMSLPVEEIFERATKVLHDLPFAKLMGMKLVDMKLDEATITLDMRDDLRQPSGILHGGVTATLIDTAMAFAVRSRVDPDVATATIDLTVHYLRPHIEGPIRCTARVVRAGRRISSVSADVFAEKNGKLIATGLSTYTIV
ncbi:MAG: PaaI family thioesterase [Acidobacteria bacterium ACB1]|nr:PaaI family thioesterase [Acidobacteria bacterium ACB1]